MSYEFCTSSMVRFLNIYYLKIKRLKISWNVCTVLDRCGFLSDLTIDMVKWNSVIFFLFWFACIQQCIKKTKQKQIWSCLLQHDVCVTAILFVCVLCILSLLLTPCDDANHQTVNGHWTSGAKETIFLSNEKWLRIHLFDGLLHINHVICKNTTSDNRLNFYLFWLWQNQNDEEQKSIETNFCYFY